MIANRYSAAFYCISGCSGKHSLTDVIYRCPNPECNGLLEVRHDLDALKRKPPTFWKSLFEQRFMGTKWPLGSGVWGKHEWIAPHVKDENVVSMFEGGTNLFWAERYGKTLGLNNLWVKMCGNSHTGSFKDLGMTVLVSTVKQMISEGKPIQAVLCASTGDTSAALSAYAAAAGIRAVVLLPKGKVTPAQLVQPLANGAIVRLLDTDFDGCMDIVKRLSKKPGIYLANSMNSLRVEGQKTVAIEIVQQDDWQVPDWVVIPGGNLGNASAIGAGFLMMKDLGLIDRLPRICVAQAETANPFYLAYKTGFTKYQPVKAGPTAATAIQIGDPVSYEKARAVLARLNGVVRQASEDQIATAGARADSTGMFNCPQTCVALAATEQLVSESEIQPNHRVVVLSTALGLKFVDFKTEVHTGGSRYANPMIDLSANYNEVESSIMKAIEAS